MYYQNSNYFKNIITERKKQNEEYKRKAFQFNEYQRRQKKQTSIRNPLELLQNPSFIFANLVIMILLAVIIFDKDIIDKTTLNKDNKLTFLIKNSVYILFSFFTLLLLKNRPNVTNVLMQNRIEVLLSIILLIFFGFLSFSKGTIQKFIHGDNVTMNKLIKILSDMIFIYILIWKFGYSFIKGFTQIDYIKSIQIGLGIVITMLLTTIGSLYSTQLYSDKASKTKVDFIQKAGLTTILVLTIFILIPNIYHLKRK